VKGEATKPLAEVLKDTERVNFYRGYVDAAIDAVEQDQVLHHSSKACFREHQLADIQRKLCILKSGPFLGSDAVQGSVLSKAG